MIYLASPGNQLVILEPDELDHIRAGGTLMAPNNRIAVMYTPDAVFMSEMIKKCQQTRTLTAGAIDVIHRNSLTREPVRGTGQRPLTVLVPSQEEADAHPAEQN